MRSQAGSALPVGAGAAAALTAALALAAAVAFGQVPATGPSPPTGASLPVAAAERIEQLVKDLGDDNYRTRASAQEELVKIGPPAIPALEKALESTDQEVSLRAKAALAEIHKSAAEARSAEAARNVLWTVPLPGGLVGPLAVAGEVVLVRCGERETRALEASTGKVLWTHQGQSNPESVLLTWQGRVYLLDKDDNLRCLDARTGKEVPQFRSQAIFGSAAFADGVIYAPGFRQSFWAIDAKTGEHLWETPEEKGRFSFGAAPALDAKAVYVNAGGGKVIAFDRKTGKELWSSSTGKSGVLDPGLATGDGQVLVRTEAGIHALDAASGKQAWEQAFPQPNVLGQIRQKVVVNGKEVGPSAVTGSPALVLAGGKVFLALEDRLAALDLASGKEVWSYQPQAKGAGDRNLAAGGNGIIVVAGGQGQVRMVVNAGGQRIVIRDLSSGASGLAVAAGVIYCGGADGLAAVGIKAGTEIWRLKTDRRLAGAPVVSEGVLYFATGALINVMPAEGKPADPQAAGPRLYAVRLKVPR